MKDILTKEKLTKADIKTLAIDYKQRTGNSICLSCDGEIKAMIKEQKKRYMKTQYELKKPRVIYKLEKGGKETISNDKMTDELAERFLEINPDRIKLFSKFPDNYKPKDEDCCDGDDEPCKDCLEKKKLSELKEEYPNIPVEFGQSKADFIEKILNQ